MIRTYDEAMWDARLTSTLRLRWHAASGPVGIARLEDDGATLLTEARIDRHSSRR